MPEDILPRLPERLTRLISMEPTRPNLDAFLGGFTVSNVFASRPPDRSADLFLVLPDASGDHLLPQPRPSHYAQREDILGAFIRDAEQKHGLEERRLEQARELIKEIDRYWGRILAAYTKPVLLPSDEDGGGYSPKGCACTVTLPDKHLLRRLLDEGATHHLLILVARHELISLYRAVYSWHALTPSQRLGSPLSNREWYQLTSWGRMRGQWVMEQRYDEESKKSVDAPKMELQPTNEMARLFRLFGTWVKKIQEGHIQNLPIAYCEKILKDGSRCPNPVLPRRGGGAKNGGAPYKYCAKHTTSRKRSVSVNN